MRRYATYALCAAITAGAAPALAQSATEGQSCGGLLCDIGVFGHKTAPQPANQAVVAPKPAPSAVAEAVPPKDITPEPVKAPKKPVVHRKRIAKAVVVPVHASSSAPAAPPPKSAQIQVYAPKKVSAPAPISAPTAAAHKPKVVADAPTPPQATPTAASAPVAPPPPAFRFRPLYNF